MIVPVLTPCQGAPMDVDRIDDLYVDGSWQGARSSAMTTVTNPTTEEDLAEVVCGDAVDVHAAVRAADRAAGAWARTPVAERCALVEHLAQEIEARAASFAELISREHGAPVGESSHAPAQAAGHLRH